MSKEFVREEKYIVVKWEDSYKYLSPEQEDALESLLHLVSKGRAADGKPAYNRYVVVNEDEPYAEIVWKLIELWETKKEGSNEPG